ncbi:MAG: translation elongation factor Ts [Gemmatimonadetes bacterium]|nr:translation elongation factor Ts [Gemmatimonadota bacterium]
MTISAKQVQELRERTGAGMMECKRALEETNGDIEKAIDVLRTRGAAKAAKRAGRETREGGIGSYVHLGGKSGAPVEVNCETDFVARNEIFQGLLKDLAMHIAASDPLAVAEADVPVDIVEHERSIYREQVKGEGKPEHLWEKITDGRMKKFFQERTLLQQPFVKNPDISVAQLVQETTAKTGENIQVRRFVRFAVGD